MERTAFRTCPFCEATCGLEVTLRGDEVVKVRGDGDDVFSRGFLCPKGVALKDLHEDPDRLRTPLVRGADGELAPASWEEAWALIGDRLPRIAAEHGRDAVGVYIGNPAAHGLAALLYGRVVIKALGTHSVFSASTVDQRPKEIACALMFGTPLSVPIPDVDRTMHLLMLGANPLASNGSLMTAPDMRGRLRALQARGGKLVVVDPRRSRTAEVADEHHPIRPGTDAQLLFALVHVLFEEGLAAPGRLAELTDGIAAVEELAQPFTPEAVAPVTGIPADAIRRMARELAAAGSAAVYGRIGTTTQEFGTLASWLVDVLNVLTGNLDRPGGAMFTRAAAGQRNSSGAPGRGRATQLARRRTRVRGLPESLGELPAAALAEEIETPGEGQLRALITLAGNPARSMPNSGRMERALEGLDLLVCVDIYVNETTRHADVILPAPSPLERSHYDLALYQLAIRNVANFSPPVVEATVPDEWVTLLRLAAVAAGQPAPADVEPFDRFVASELIRREAADEHSPLHGATPTRCSPRWSRGAARSGCSTCCCAPGRTTSRSPTSRRRRTASTSARSSRGCRTPCGPRAAGSSSRPSRSSPTSRGCAPRSTARRTAGSCSSGAASCARTTRGCTTSSCSSAGRSAARCRSTPTTRSGSGSPTAARRGSRTAPARSRRPSR